MLNKKKKKGKLKAMNGTTGEACVGAVGCAAVLKVKVQCPAFDCWMIEDTYPFDDSGYIRIHVPEK